VRVRLRLFAAAREAAGTGADEFDLPAGARLASLLDAACARYQGRFPDVLSSARVWVNGDEPLDGGGMTLHEDDEIAVLPPVSGGADI
jgi:molybdopterin converting factor small subunit